MDSGIFIALANTRDQNHGSAIELAERLRRGELGTPYTSDYVFDEVVTTALVRTGKAETAVRAGVMILGSEEQSVRPMARLVKVDEETFSKAWSAFKTKRNPRLSFTDHTILAQIKAMALSTLVSFDSGFDGLVKRVS